MADVSGAVDGEDGAAVAELTGLPSRLAASRAMAGGALGGRECGEKTDGESNRDVGKKRVLQVFDKDLTVSVEVVGGEPVTMLQFMQHVRIVCGGLLACRSTGAGKYEVTMSHVRGKDRLLDGFKIGEAAVLAKALSNDELMVS